MPNITRSQSRRTALVGRTAICVSGMFLLACLGGCGSGASTTASSGASLSTTGATAGATIRLQNIAIHPSKVTIQQGSTVTWQWLDGHIDTPHNVTSLPGGPQFKASGTRQTGSYSVRFDKPGKYLYECTIHPASMQGEIVVE